MALSLFDSNTVIKCCHSCRIYLYFSVTSQTTGKTRTTLLVCDWTETESAVMLRRNFLFLFLVRSVLVSTSAPISKANALETFLTLEF